MIFMTYMMFTTLPWHSYNCISEQGILSVQHKLMQNYWTTIVRVNCGFIMIFIATIVTCCPTSTVTRIIVTYQCLCGVLMQPNDTELWSATMVTVSP